MPNSPANPYLHSNAPGAAQMSTAEAWRFAQSALDALTAHIAILDEAGRILAVNRAWRQFAQDNGALPGETFEGANYLHVCETAEGDHCGESNPVADGIRSVIRGERELYILEYPCHSPTEQRWFNVRVTRFEGDEQARVVVSHENITERKLAELALLEKQQHIEMLNARLRRSMTETHHRVKNNLQIVAALLDMQMMEHARAVPNPELKQLAMHIHALSLVHDLLTEQAKIDGRATHVSVKAVLDGLLTMLQKTIGGRHIRFHLDEVTLPANQGTSLAIIANELVSNALKYGKSQVRVSLTRREHDAILEVTDDGPGFPADFNSVKAARTGLDLVQNLSRLDLRGEIRYANAPEGGGRVSVAVPFASRAAAD